MRILHISDLHARGIREQRRAFKRTLVLGDAWRNNLDALAADGRPFDLVAFTGDVADWALTEEYAKATSFVTELLAHLKVPRERFFVVPGNHDIRRTVKKAEWDKMREGIWSAPQQVGEWMAGARRKPPFGFEPAWRTAVLKRERAFWTWVKRDLGRDELLPARSPHGRLGYRVSLSIGGHPVHIIGLDSAWLAGDDSDAGRLWLTEDQLGRLCLDPRGQSLPGFRLALVHHPLSHLADADTAVQRLADTVDLVLRGHQHTPVASTQHHPGRSLRELAAGCLYEGDHSNGYPNGCQVIDVVFGPGGRPLRYEIRFRAWSSNGFWHDDGSLYVEAAHGRLTWDVIGGNAFPESVAAGSVGGPGLEQSENRDDGSDQGAVVGPKADVTSNPFWGRWVRAARLSRRRIIAFGIAVAFLGTLGIAALWPPLSIPMLPGPPGVVVAGRWLTDDSSRGAWRHVCDVLRKLGEQSVQCISLAPVVPSDEKLVNAARDAGAWLVVVVETGPAARILPVLGPDGGREAAQLLDGLPSLSIAQPETRIALAHVAYMLTHDPRDIPVQLAARLPIQPSSAMPWRVTAMAALAKLWTQARWDDAEADVLARLARHCEQDVSVADGHCALIQYLYYEHVRRKDSDAEEKLKELGTRGPQSIADLAMLALLRRRCLKDPQWARAVLLEVAQRARGCERWFLMTPASCVLAASDSDDERIHALASPHEGDAPCPAERRADAYYDLAFWWAEEQQAPNRKEQGAANREEWERAVASYKTAFRLDPLRPEHRLGLAEALLFLRSHSSKPATQLTEQIMSLLSEPGQTESERTTVMFLSWLAQGDQDGVSRLCQVYKELPEGEIAMPDVNRRLACMGDDQEGSIECQMYELLSKSKEESSGTISEVHVCATAGDKRAP